MKNVDLLGRAVESGGFDVRSTTDVGSNTELQSTSSTSSVYVRQGDRSYEIEALDSADYGDRTVEEFYGYGQGDGASANTPNDMERSDLSQLFLYDGPEGMSLVAIHDAANDGDGGAVTFQFDDLPAGDWVVPDDPGDDDYDREEIGWRWYSCCTDGGAYRWESGQGFYFEVDPNFKYGIDSTAHEEPWVVVDGSGSGIERLPIDPTEPVTITSAGEIATTEDDTDYTVDFSTDVCVDVEDVEGDVCVSSQPKVRLGPRLCQSRPGGTTPPLASVEVTYVEVEETEDGTRVSYEQTIWFGIELSGEPCIWYGEENFEICGKLEGCRSGPSPNVLGVPDPREALDAARDILDDIEDEAPEIRLPTGAGEQLLKGIIAVGLIILAIVALPAEAVAVIAIAGITLVAVTAEELRSDDDGEQT